MGVNDEQEPLATITFIGEVDDVVIGGRLPIGVHLLYNRTLPFLWKRLKGYIP